MYQAARTALLVSKEQVQSVLDAWLAAQNSGDFDAYMAAYSEDVRGVRRSGKKTVRLDRAGWENERRRMFKRPMQVALRELNIAVNAGGAELRFIQDWRAGRYHDVGPKKLVVRKTEHGLRIAREEMLRSTLLGSSSEALPLASAMLALVFSSDLVLLSDEPDTAWLKGRPKLLQGEVPERDAECDDNPPDYELENNRYFYCETNGPENTKRSLRRDAAGPSRPSAQRAGRLARASAPLVRRERGAV